MGERIGAHHGGDIVRLCHALQRLHAERELTSRVGLGEVEMARGR
jgi:hypothetical protein